MNETESLVRFDAALAALGASADVLSPEAAASLDTRGYQVFADLISSERAEELRQGVEEAGALPPAAGERQVTGTRHVDPLARGSRAFDAVLREPAILAATRHILNGAFRISSLSCRDPQPGYGEQGLHADWGPRPPEHPRDPAWIVTVIWILDDFTEENGATRVVPGSHVLPGLPSKKLAQPGKRHPDEELVTARAGSVLVFNGHLWHSGTRNQSSGPRRTLQMSFVSTAQRYHAHVTHPAPQELPEAVRILIDPQG